MTAAPTIHRDRATSARDSDVRKPTFLFIGGDRCGSKSLHKFFQQHPDCYVPPIADPYFFDKNYDRGHDWYWSLFAAAPADALAVGEFSHDYIQSEAAAERIAKDLPDVKILATIRHPVERTLSSYTCGVSSMLIRGTLEEALDAVPMLTEYSIYADKLERYIELFGRDRVKVMLFDDLEADPRKFATDAFEFVGLPPTDTVDYGVRMNVRWKSRWPLSGPISKLGAITLRKLGWVELLGRVKGNPRIRAIFRKPLAVGDRPEIAPETRRRLNAIFAPQIDRLESMLDRDLSAWRN